MRFKAVVSPFFRPRTKLSRATESEGSRSQSPVPPGRSLNLRGDDDAAALMPALCHKDCPLCGSPSRPRFAKEGHWIQDCSQCGHRFTALTPTPEHLTAVYSDDYFEGGGAGYPDYLAEGSALRQHGQRYARRLHRYLRPGRMLDVGAAAGFVFQGFGDEGWQGNGLEPNDRMASYGRTQLGLPIRTGSLEMLPSDEQYDLVSMIQVVAHFYDVQAAFGAAATVTKPGGYWLIETWNCQSWMAKILGANWHEYSPPSVLHFFSPSTLRQLAAQHGFVEIQRGYPSKWIKAAHGKSLLRYKLKSSRLGLVLLPLLHLIPDRLMLPYPAEDLFWAIYQKRST
jgi:SAM-dependent methyltransferase